MLPPTKHPSHSLLHLLILSSLFLSTHPGLPKLLPQTGHQGPAKTDTAATPWNVHHSQAERGANSTAVEVSVVRGTQDPMSMSEKEAADLSVD